MYQSRGNTSSKGCTKVNSATKLDETEMMSKLEYYCVPWEWFLDTEESQTVIGATKTKRCGMGTMELIATVSTIGKVFWTLTITAHSSTFASGGILIDITHKLSMLELQGATAAMIMCRINDKQRSVH